MTCVTPGGTFGKGMLLTVVIDSALFLRYLSNIDQFFGF